MTKPRNSTTSSSTSNQPPLFNEPTGIDLKPFKTIRIAVSGDVSVNKLEKDIIDTPHFQRLRGIKQLGTTYLLKLTDC